MSSILRSFQLLRYPVVQLTAPQQKIYERKSSLIKTKRSKLFKKKLIMDQETSLIEGKRGGNNNFELNLSKSSLSLSAIFFPQENLPFDKLRRLSSVTGGKLLLYVLVGLTFVSLSSPLSSGSTLLNKTSCQKLDLLDRCCVCPKS
jgi:hypothetical protein